MPTEPLVILAATDFSDCSDAAVAMAAEYARKLGARLHLLHVVWPMTDAQADTRLERLVHELPRELEVTPAVRSGVPAVEIVRYAQRHDVDLIVVGTHGRSGVSRALVGSVAERLVRTARRPVLVVPHHRRERRKRGEELHLEPHRCIVCGQASDDLICESCRARIRGEALEHKRGEERAGR